MFSILYLSFMLLLLDVLFDLSGSFFLMISFFFWFILFFNEVMYSLFDLMCKVLLKFVSGLWSMGEDMDVLWNDVDLLSIGFFIVLLICLVYGMLI